MSSLGFNFDLAVAGLGPLIWHWGAGVGLIVLLVLAEMFCAQIPFGIGAWLMPFRKRLLWIAAGIAVFLFGMGVGVKDANQRNKAKVEVVNTKVDKAVRDAAGAPARGVRDPWSRE